MSTFWLCEMVEVCSRHSFVHWTALCELHAE